MSTGATKMSDKLKKIKVLFGDVDNTLLCLKMYNEEGKRIVGFEDANDWLKYNINNNAYIKCQAPSGVKNLIDDLHFKITRTPPYSPALLSTNSVATNSASLPSLAFCLRKLGKKNTFSMANIIKSLMPMMSQSVLPSVICRKPS